MLEPGPWSLVPAAWSRYFSHKHGNDIGLVFLSRALSARPMSLRANPPQVGARVRLVGFGVDEEGNSGVKRQADNQVRYVLDDWIRVEGSGGGCFGDSGGPSIDLASGQLVGLIANGPGCEATSILRTDRYLGWMREQGVNVPNPVLDIAFDRSGVHFAPRSALGRGHAFDYVYGVNIGTGALRDSRLVVGPTPSWLDVRLTLKGDNRVELRNAIVDWYKLAVGSYQTEVRLTDAASGYVATYPVTVVVRGIASSTPCATLDSQR